MRQRITVENLAELSPEQQEKLRVWWKHEEYDVFVSKRDNYSHSVDWVCGDEIHYFYSGAKSYTCVGIKICLPFLSIGQLLQLLDDFTEEPSLKNENLRLSINRTMWLGNSKLVDSLFQAVKEIL